MSIVTGASLVSSTSSNSTYSIKNVVYLGSMEDFITQHNEHMDETHLQQSMLKRVLDTVSDRVYLKDPKGFITYANKAFLDTFGEGRDIVGRHGDEVLPPEMQEPCRRADEEVILHKEPVFVEVCFHDDEGKLHWSEAYKSPVLDQNGKIIGIVGVGRDVTTRKREEEKFKQQEALLIHASRLSTLGQLIAEVVHEINQPCYAILNFAKAIENTLQSQGEIDIEGIRKWNSQILNEATRMGRITQQLRSYVRRDVSRCELAQLNEIALESIEFVAREARNAKIVIEQDFAEGLPELSVDRVQLQQVIVNLLRNAIEALVEFGSTSPLIRVLTREMDGEVEIMVVDNGPGIPQGFQDHIFEPFQTSKSTGIGLGLPISKTIVESHEGTIDFESKEGEGTCFYCVFRRSDRREED